MRRIVHPTAFLLTCLMATAAPAQLPKKFDVEGHRGCRGLMPENTLAGFLRAVDLGVTTLEMDAVITQDGVVILSHEPFLSHEICLDAAGQPIAAADEKTHNLYRMTYAQVQQCDCGTPPNARFPTQQRLAAPKPRLADVIDSVEAHVKRNNLPPVQYNIETKSKPETDGTFHPAPAEFVTRLMSVVQAKKIEKRVIIQSFDPRTLRVMRQQFPRVRLALLVGNPQSAAENVKKLGFTPTIYSPPFAVVNAELVSYCRANKMQLIPWTANEPADIARLIALGVDGLISDYPDRVLTALKK